MPFHNDEYILVRGIPIMREDVVFHQQRLGAQLFDESMFSDYSKRIACANVLVELDKQLAINFMKYGPLGEDEIRALDIGDPGWLYIPIALFAPGGNVIMVGSKDSPVGKYGWFRMKKNMVSPRVH